jgi:ribosomal protein S12 methylthiotransferase
VTRGIVVKVHLVTLGCPKNLVDSEATLSLLRRNGCETAGDPAAADVLLVNACSFLDSAWQETVEETRRLARYKRGSKKRLVLMGCLPKHRGEDLESSLPWVDHFLPTGAHARLPEMVAAWEAASPVARSVVRGDASRFAAFEGRDLLTPAHTAYVKVAEGCNRACTFCAIPIIRGRQEARDADSIVREVEAMVARGVREVTLLAQDIVSYRDAVGTRFHQLVERVVATGVEWVRIFYVHPAGVGVDYVSRLFEHKSVCRYLEMPVQHSSSRLLHAMQRSYSREHVAGLVTDIRAAFPDVVIRSEVIVGFPGESEQEFEDLKAFVRDFAFDSLGVFPYSPEPGTKAAALDGAVSAPLIADRVAELATVQEAASFAARARFRDTTLRVLVDRADDDGAGNGARFAGRFYGQALEIDGEVYVTGNAAVGEFVDARVTETDVFDLYARVVPDRRGS